MFTRSNELLATQLPIIVSGYAVAGMTLGHLKAIRTQRNSRRDSCLRENRTRQPGKRLISTTPSGLRDLSRAKVSTLSSVPFVSLRAVGFEEGSDRSRIRKLSTKL